MSGRACALGSYRGIGKQDPLEVGLPRLSCLLENAPQVKFGCIQRHADLLGVLGQRTP
jgi:hypothetical protein